MDRSRPDEKDYLAQDEVDELKLPKHVADFVVGLRDPDTSGVLFLLGTAHVSAVAGQDAEELISAAQPLVVGVELDQRRLNNVMDMLKHGDELPHPPTSTLKVLPLLFSPQGWLKLFSEFNKAAHFYVLGWPYGIDMMDTIRAAEAVGAVIVPVDRDAVITLMRAIREFQTMQEDQINDKVQVAKGRDLARQAAIEKVKKYCDEPEMVLESARRLLDAVTKAKKLSAEDLLRVRMCGRNLIECSRRDAIKNDNPDWNIEGPGKIPAALGPERDLILAQNLRRLTHANPRVVGVVGAAHVPGIRHHWPDALSEAKLALAKEYNKIPQGEQARANIAGPLLVMAGAGFLAVYRPRLLWRITAATTAIAATGAFITAHNIAKVGRGLEKLGETAQELEVLERGRAS